MERLQPIVPVPSRLATFATWAALTAMFSACWWAPSLIDDAVWVGLALAIAVIARGCFLGAAARTIAAGASIVMVGALGGPTTMIGSLGVGSLAAGGAIARRARMERRLRAFREAVRAGRAGERAFVAVAGWPSPWFYAATGYLLQEHRLGPAVRLLRGRPAGRRDASLHTMQLVGALLDLGATDEARDVVDRIAGLTANGRELRTYLDARVRIAGADAATVAARVGLEPEDGAHPAWRSYRLLVRADAAAALGDREESRRLLAALPEPGRTRALTLLRSTDRPAAALAAELLDGTAAPYR